MSAVAQVEMLAFLSSVAKGVPQKLEVMSQLVSSLFDLNPNISSYMKVRGGRSGCSALLGLLGLDTFSVSSAAVGRVCSSSGGRVCSS